MADSARSPRARRSTSDDTIPLREAVRRTGIPAELLRAWERRYGAVTPIRTPGGSRRYSAHDVERLTRIKAAVDAGHRISKVVAWGEARWAGFLDQTHPATHPAVDSIVDALAELDGETADRELTELLEELGPVDFAREIALPLLDAIGFLWTQQKASVASEHMASALLRTLLGNALRQTPPHEGAPRILFATPSGERHELGLLVAALVTRAAGGLPVYLGPELPPAELAEACRRTHIDAIALSAVSLDASVVVPELEQTRQLVAKRIAIWVGGASVAGAKLPRGIQLLGDFEDLEARVQRLSEKRAATG